MWGRRGNLVLFGDPNRIQRNTAHLFHSSDNVDVAVQDHSQGNDEAEYEQVDDVRSCVCIVRVPIDGAAESGFLSTRFSR